MANKQEKMFSITSTKEMQIREHFTPVDLAKSTVAELWRGCGTVGLLFIVGESVN